MLDLNKIYCIDCLEGMKQMDDDSIDLIVTDPPYGLTNLNAEKLIKNEEIKSKGFMGKEWDNIPPTQVWKECLRVLKPGAFAFIMCVPRQDCQLVMQYRLMKAGFNISFTSVYWTYSSGFPKAGNISRLVDKRLGVERKVIGKEMVDIGMQSGTMHAGRPVNVVERDKTIATSDQAKALDGSYSGFQPKPAVEVIIVAMKPLSEKTYVDQALKNGKGITWLGDCKIPYLSDKDKEGAGYGTQADIKGANLKGDKKPCGIYGKNILASSDGRFPANLLVNDDILNTGKNWKAGGSVTGNEPSQPAKNVYGEYGRVAWQSHGDSGSYSRYFDLDYWFSEKIRQLPKEIQKTFPFMIIPKSSRSQKDAGCKNTYTLKENVSDEDIKNIKNILEIRNKDEY